jgi:AcrR family transcriptional regulator
VTVDADHAARRRRYGAALERALLDAAWDELHETGYVGFTMDAVASRAGTSRPVLYRRWPNRAQLVLAAVRAHVPPLRAGDFPDTGQLRSDLLADLRLRRSRYESIRPDIMNGLASELDQPPSGAPDVSANIAAAVARAAGRDEIGPHPVPAHILDVPHALLRHELAIRHHRPTDAELAQIIDDITIPAIQRASHHPGHSEPGKD